MILISGIITALYCTLILLLRYGWEKLPPGIAQNTEEKVKFSILVPFRNEAENLPFLLKSISELKYPRDHFEVILIDDDSEDSSVEVIKEFRDFHPTFPLKILKNERHSGSPKKDAITMGVKNANFAYIFTTDADCILPQSLLEQYSIEIQRNGYSLMAGPVAFGNSYKINPLLKNFQDLDFISLQATGAAAFGLKKPFLCNGANLCYKKSDFLEVNGFAGNNNISSGDDVFLLQKFVEHQKNVRYLKHREAIVITNYQSSIRGLFQQRIRWAAKTTEYSGVFSKITGILVLLMNFLLVSGVILAGFGTLPASYLLLIFLLKFSADLFLLYPAANFFNKKQVLRNFWFCSLLYPFFTTYVAISSLFTGFEWKGRKYNQ